MPYFCYFHPKQKTSFSIALLTALLTVTISSAWAKPRTCDARAMGAKGDGQTKDTVALQHAIDVCAKNSGGTVHLTAGAYVSGPLDLKSHVRLLLDKDSTLLGSPDMADFPIRADAPWRKISLIHADHAEDISISGAGIIDGNGKIWWDAKAQAPRGVPEAPRPLLIDLTNSKHILIEGVTIRNSPMYNITTFLCDGLTVRNITILNPGRGAPNTDGIDPVSTSHVLIEHTTIDTGDDNVAIKSGLIERGDPNVPSTDIIIRDCIFRAGHGLSIGSETAGGVRNVTVERVSFHGTRQGIRIKSARGRGNDIGNFTYRDITMEDVETPIQITNYYTGNVKDDPGQPIAEHTPRFHDITIENVTATGAKHAGVVMGLPESPVKNLVLRNVHLSAETGMTMQYAQITEEGLVVKPASGGAIISGPGVTINGK